MRFRASENSSIRIPKSIANWLRTWNYIKWWWQSSAIFKVTRPEFRPKQQQLRVSTTSLNDKPGEFPFRISGILNRPKNQSMLVVRNSTYSYILIWVTHHSNQHVKQDDNHDGRIHSIHQQTNKHRKCVFFIDLKCLKINQAECSPEESLQWFEKTREKGTCSYCFLPTDWLLGKMFIDLFGTVFIFAGRLFAVSLFHSSIIPK